MDKDYWRLKKREQRAKKKVAVAVQESVDPRRPAEATDGQWAYALERAERARKYAAMFPEHVRTSEVVFQDPLWQWQNEARKRTL